VPAAWHVGAKFVHEIWAPSAFCAEAFEPLAPGRVRVVPYPLAALPPPRIEGGRGDFGLPEGALVVLVVFNLASSRVRKNPEGAIRAFRAAFGDRRDRVLVLKLSGTSLYPGDRAEIRAMVADAPNIRVIDETIPEPALRGLIAASDIVMSLHRAEGFGLIPATAMLLGRPVVTTGWSGNMSFMDAESAALVKYDLVPVNDPRGTYRLQGSRWAEPDFGHAAVLLRQLADDPSARAALAARGREMATRALGDAPVRDALAASGIR
ncbi:MAG: glycosyl transferase family 1, partial [Acidiphilium sp. 21-68-69]